MKTKETNKRKKTVGFLIILFALSAFCWDLATVEGIKAVEGTFRYVKDFDAISTAPTQVAIVPSDFKDLTIKRSRDSDISYQQVEDMVKKAIELQGGINGVIEKGDKVMLKVNLVGGSSPSGEGENTDVRVPKAIMKVIDDLLEGDVEFMIAEGTARSNDNPDDASSVWENSGYRDLISDPVLNDITFKLVNINQTYNDLREVPLETKGTAAPHNYTYMIHKDELDADVYISVPVLKIHDPGITCALKNQIGTAPGAYYGYNKMRGSSYYGGLVHVENQNRDWTAEEIVDLSMIANIDFVVVDAIMCLEACKVYTGDNQVRMNTIVAGADPVAVDHVCAKLFCLNPADIDHITLAERVGLGTNNAYLIDIKGAEINDVRKKVIKTSSIPGVFGQSNRTWILSKTFSGNMATEHIPNEASIEPVGGVDDWTEPIYFFDDMIDLLSFYNEATNIVTYAFTYFYSPSDKEAELLLGSHEDIIVYINGEQVHSFSGMRGSSGVGSESENITIKKGENRLLIKTLNTLGDYSFSLNICDLESSEQYSGNRVDGLVFYTKKGDYSDIPETKSITKFLLQNYPNPVINTTQIEFELPNAAKTSVNIYDLEGRLVSTLENDYLSAGLHTLEWKANYQNGRRVSSGIYLCKVQSKNYSSSIKILVR